MVFSTKTTDGFDGSRRSKTSFSAFGILEDPSFALHRSIEAIIILSRFISYKYFIKMVNIKTDEKKQHFDDIYVEPTPVPYKIRILDALDYISDDFSKLCRAVHLIPSNDALTSSPIVRFGDVRSTYPSVDSSPGWKVYRVC
jgi:hypothetical protein